MDTRIMAMLTLWLTIAVTGVWANELQIRQNTEGVDNIPDEVELRDGTVVKMRKTPQRAPVEDYVYTYKGVKYTYITENNYKRFFNTNVHQPSDYGWYTDAEGWYVNAEKAYITAASIDADNFPSSGETYILNDLVGFFSSHTHLGCITDNGFRYMPGVRRIYFQDCAATSYTANSDFYFFIGDCAFADCANLEEVNMMQWTTSGDNHWQALPPTAVKRIWGSMLNNSPKAWLRVGTSVYQQYLGSQTWAQVRSRITTFEHSSDDITVNGTIYSFLKGEDGSALSNADDKHEEIMKTLRLWNADYKQFNAASLLSDKSRTKDNANIWYTTVKGADASYLKSHDGVLRIYNDPGSYYNYKTIAIRKGAFENCDDLKAVEFWQTNGRSDNSYSDLKMVIENGAFKNCKNLKEIRMFYKVEDGTDHWQVLGPKDVIPGNNIFGLPTADEIATMDGDQLRDSWTIDPDFRILVSPDRYSEFKEDPNWAGYIAYLHPADYMPAAKPDINKGGLTYGYMATGDGTYNTDQVVTQDFSMWSIPIIVAEVAMIVYSTYNIVLAAKEAATLKAAIQSAGVKLEELGTEAYQVEQFKNAIEATAKFFGNYAKGALTQKDLAYQISKLAWIDYGKNVAEFGIFKSTTLYNQLLKLGIIDSEGIFRMTTSQVYFLFLERASTETAKGIEKFLRTALENSSGVLMEKTSKVAIATGATLSELSANKIAAPVAEQIFKYSLIANPTIIGATIGSNIATCNLLGRSLNAAALKRGMQSNIIANMHQLSTHAMNMVIITPDKNLIYHTFIKSAPDDIKDAVIYTSVSKDTRTTTWMPKVFQNKKQLRTVRFHDNSDRTSHNMSANLIYIPDSAFVGCDALETLDLRLLTDNNGQRAMGPENFVLCGNDIFAGLDSLKFKIIIPNERREDFLNDEMWQQHKRFFKYEDVEENTNYTEFGVRYAFTYQNGNQYVEKMGGHKIEHLHAIGADDNYILANNGAIGLFNDIGSYNNYKLDYVRKGAFRDKVSLRSVSFWDVAGWLWTGDAYTDLQMMLQDYCFADCPNLEYVDMLYLRTDGSNIAEPLTPAMLQLGKGVFNNSPKVRFKMTDRQTEWFAADTTWVKYKDRFLPCLFLPSDPVVVSKLSDMKYHTDVARPWYDNNASKWGDWLDMTRVKEFSYLNGKFSNNTDLRSFPDFKRFELIGLDYVGGSWFIKCSNLNAIELPSTIKTIGGWAFYGCSSLKEITLPSAVAAIDASAFEYSGLKTVRCEGMKPATLGTNAFNLTSFEGFTIYVPAEAVDAYKTAWSNLAQYIKSDADDRVPNEVEVDQPGKLAEKLGLTMIMDGDRLRSVGGAYWKYDSLTVRGHLNGLDVGVLRHMMGADAWDSDPTEGRLRYLDLHDAHLDKDTKYSYNLWGVDEYLEKENWVGEYMFHNCTAIETLILPATVTEIGENAFQGASNLRRLFVAEKLESYTRDLIQDIKEGLDELVFMTDNFATSESDDPWEGPIGHVFTKKSQLGKYMSDAALTNRARSIYALFEDDEVMHCLTARRCYFPSQYMDVESTKNPHGNYSDGNGYFFYRDNYLINFDEFRLFSKIRVLDYDFEDCRSLERITLPDSLERIGYNAFTGCKSLATIHISADSVPVLALDAFRDLPADFQIIVPKTHVKRYRDKWKQYALNIVGEDEKFRNDIIEVTLTEPNTLAEKLGLKVKVVTNTVGTADGDKDISYIASITGDYSHIRGLKVNGPISCGDFTVMRFLAGYDVMRDLNNTTPFGGCRNYFGPLEYIDLYDADIEPSYYLTDGVGWQTGTKLLYPWEDDCLPGFAFGRCYSLKTLILPRTMKRVKERAFQECEYLETLVIGDDCEEFIWSALDDCASITRMYILSKKKMEMDNECWLIRSLYNNYSPTFDAFYVRPTLYLEYTNDEAYVGSQQRTNNISSGAFKDDESFAAFASHAAATVDDLRSVSDITGWFRGHETAIDLNALKYTSIDSLRTADMAPLTEMRNITLPATIKGVGKDAFKDAAGMRYVDLSLCADYAPTLASEGGVRSLGITERTLAYVPAQYGETEEVNVAVGGNSANFRAKTVRLYDGEDYVMPFRITADNVENTRTLARSEVPYTVSLPYKLDIPEGAVVYRLKDSNANELVFTQTDQTFMEEGQPYLVRSTGDISLNNDKQTELEPDNQLMTGEQSVTGYTLRSTFKCISNEEANELGAYVLQSDGMWHAVLTDTDEHRRANVPAYRCYLLQSRAPGANSIRMILDDSTSGIDRIRTIDNDGTERVYDLNGRLVDGNTKGVVIKNGRKVINK